MKSFPASPGELYSNTRAASAAALVLLALASVLGGCGLIKTTASIPGEAVRAVSMGGKKETVQTDPVVLQQDIFRFSDEYANTLSADIDRLSQQRPGFEASTIVRMKLNVNYRLLEIASGPNDYVNLCDLVCLVVISRYTFEQYWIPQVLHEAGQPTLKKLIEFERQITELAKNSLGTEAHEKLTTHITTWLNTSYEPGMSLLSRYTGLSADVVRKTDTSHGEKNNLLGALMLDPLAGLDPTVREIAQTRLFAERAMFVGQRMPKIVRMEGELLSHRLIETPQITQLIANVDTLTASTERMSRVAEGLPDLIRTEREAVLKGLNEQTPELIRLMAETHATIEATAQAMTATNTVVQTTDRFLERLGVYEKPASASQTNTSSASDKASPAPAASAAPSAPPAEPFRIQDYTAAAAQLAISADHLNVLLLSLDKTLGTATSPEVAGKVAAASQTAIESGRALVDHVFWRALILGLVFCISVPLVVFICRRTGLRTSPQAVTPRR